MTKNVNYVSHKKSKLKDLNGKPQLPSPSVLVEGEIAVNYAEGVETLSIKNESGTVVTFSSDNYYTEQKLGSGFTNANSANTVTSVIIENERITATALNDLNTNKLDTSAYTENLANYYTKSETSGKTEISTALNDKANRNEIPAVSGYADSVKYNSNSKYVEFYHGGTGGTKVYEYDASPFIIDGMVNNVEIKDVTISGESVTCLVVSFNTDAGKQDINIPVSEIFNTNNYYTITEIDDIVGSGFTTSSITEVIIEDEKAIAGALNELNANKLDISAYTEAITDLDNRKADISTISALTFPSSAVTAMTGYAIADSGAPITTSDTLNQAIGKLEKQDYEIAYYVKQKELVTSAALNELDERIDIATNITKSKEDKLPEELIFESDGIYQIKDNKIYPVSHPDLSTQPSVLPQRYGNLPIKEVLIANGRENEIPRNAIIIEAFSFNGTECTPATCKRFMDKIVDVPHTIVEEDGNGHPYVEIGGIKWATMNVGASSETDYGNYYQYGKGSAQYAATSGDSVYSGTENPLAASADTATQEWGDNWRMPTKDELKSLTANTNYTWETNFSGSGVNGGKFTDKTDSSKYIFIPAAGNYSDGSLDNVDNGGIVWSSIPVGAIDYAYCLVFSVDGEDVGDNRYKYGFSVRGVLNNVFVSNFDITAQDLVDYLTIQTTIGSSLSGVVTSTNEATFYSGETALFVFTIGEDNRTINYTNNNNISIVSISYNDGKFIQETVKDEGWTIYNKEDVIPDFTIIRYVANDDGYYGSY